MTLKEAIDLLDTYSEKADEFDPGSLVVGVSQEELTMQVLKSGLVEVHMYTPTFVPEQRVADAIVHGICIGALMVRKDEEEAK